MRLRKLIFAVVGAMFLAACGGGHSDHATSATGKAADVAFLQGMIPHHQQAVTMADLAATRASSPAVKDIAVRIKGAQDPEIVQMRDMLTDLGASGASGEHAAHADHEGMLGDSELQALRAANGVEFDRLFVKGMIAHHEGAIAASQRVIADGENAEVKALAQRIIDTQRDEITELKALS